MCTAPRRAMMRVTARGRAPAYMRVPTNAHGRPPPSMSTGCPFLLERHQQADAARRPATRGRGGQHESHGLTPERARQPRGVRARRVRARARARRGGGVRPRMSPTSRRARAVGVSSAEACSNTSSRCAGLAPRVPRNRRADRARDPPPRPARSSAAATSKMASACRGTARTTATIDADPERGTTSFVASSCANQRAVASPANGPTRICPTSARTRRAVRHASAHGLAQRREHGAAKFVRANAAPSTRREPPPPSRGRSPASRGARLQRAPSSDGTTKAPPELADCPRPWIPAAT